MNIKVGDRVTYNYFGKILIELMTSNDDVKILVEDLMNTKGIEVLKIERPKYEVVEEKKELLTEEEKEFLKQVLEFVDIEILSLNISKQIANGKKEIQFHRNADGSGVGYWYYIKDKDFNGLELDKIYTLKELGLDED